MATLLPALPAPWPLAFDDIVPLVAVSIVGDTFDLLPPIVDDGDVCCVWLLKISCEKLVTASSEESGTVEGH